MNFLVYLENAKISVKNVVFRSSENDLGSKSFPKCDTESVKIDKNQSWGVMGKKCDFLTQHCRQMEPKWSQNGAQIDENVIKKLIQK